MAGRIRSIKPETLEDDRPASLSDSAWRLWVSMWLIADDHGNCRANASYLAGQVWWAHATKPDVDVLLDELESKGSIRRYIVRGQEYAHVERWEKHQRIDNAGKARVPTPEESDSCESPRIAAIRGSDLRSPTPTPKGIPIPNTIPDSPPAQPVEPVRLTLVDAPKFEPDLEAAYAKYPRKEGKKKGFQRLRKQLTTREKYDAFVRAVENYAASRAAEDPHYTKHFDSFTSCWEDYVESAPPSQQPFPGRRAPPRTLMEPMPAQTAEQAGDLTEELLRL